MYILLLYILHLSSSLKKFKQYAELINLLYVYVKSPWVCVHRTDVNYFLFFSLFTFFSSLVFIALKNFVISFFFVSRDIDINEPILKKVRNNLSNYGTTKEKNKTEYSHQ